MFLFLFAVDICTVYTPLNSFALFLFQVTHSAIDYHTIQLITLITLRMDNILIYINRIIHHRDNFKLNH